MSFDIQTNKTEIEDVRQSQTVIKSQTDDKITELENQLIKLEIHARKRNLLFYGVQVDQSLEKEDTEAVIRTLLHKSVKLDQTIVESMSFINVHRLGQPKSRLSVTTGPPSSPPPPAIIVVFMHQSDWDLVLYSAKNLQGTRITIGTDLPVKLKKKRDLLASEAYKIRKEKHMKTRIRVVDADVILEASVDRRVWNVIKM